MGVIRRLALWLPPLLAMAGIFVLSAQPDLSTGDGLLHLVGRKIGHAVVFGALCLLWWRALRPSLPNGRSALVAVALTVAYAVTDELHQSAVEGRHGLALDVVIDSAGAALAALAVGYRRERLEPAALAGD